MRNKRIHIATNRCPATKKGLSNPCPLSRHKDGVIRRNALWILRPLMMKDLTSIPLLWASHVELSAPFVINLCRTGRLARNYLSKCC
jgi:hypothetical protein